MATPKSKKKAGKKSAPRKPRAATETRTPAPAAAPAPEQKYPCKVMVKKGSESIPREVKDKAQHDVLIAEFGADHVEVLP